MSTFHLDQITDSETLTGAKGVTITRGDIVTVGGSKITRRVMAISDKWGARLVRIDGGNQAPSVWTKQFKGIVLVKTVAEQEAEATAPKARKPRSTKAPVVAEIAPEQKGLLAAIAAAVVADDSVARNRAIVAAADAGLRRDSIAAAAGLGKVGNIIRAAAREAVSA